MTTYGTLQRTTKHKHNSVWHFIAIGNEYYAIGGCHKPLIKRFDNVDALRAFYKQMVGYGYAPSVAAVEATQLEMAL